MALTQPHTRRFTRREYEHMADLGFFEHRRVELIHGEIIEIRSGEIGDDHIDIRPAEDLLGGFRQLGVGPWRNVSPRRLLEISQERNLPAGIGPLTANKRLGDGGESDSGIGGCVRGLHFAEFRDDLLGIVGRAGNDRLNAAGEGEDGEPVAGTGGANTDELLDSVLPSSETSRPKLATAATRRKAQEENVAEMKAELEQLLGTCVAVKQ